jgi:hypothetical protein
LKADIKIFQLNAKAAGFTDKEILKQLAAANDSEAGIVDAFAKRVQSVTSAAVQRERVQSEIDAFREEFPDSTDFQWITVSSSPCPDCEARAGTVMPYTDWMMIGVPGSGQTICGRWCKCRLMPSTVADRMFPTVKSYKWDEETTVLTPMTTMKKLAKAQRS